MLLIKTAFSIANLIVGIATKDVTLACFGVYVLSDCALDVINPRPPVGP